MPMPDIQLTSAGQQSVLSASDLARHAVRVPSDVARFDGQVAVFFDDILSQDDPDLGVCCKSCRGETYSFPILEKAKYSLLSTNAPSWKLIPAGRDRLHEITVPRFLLRDVASIELGEQTVAEDASDQVYTNLTDALSRPLSVRFLNLTNARLETFPTGVFELLNLDSLNLGKNRIDSIPPTIGELRRLKVLKLSRNRLRTLPEEIGRLKQLTELHLSRNEIETLPDKFWNLDKLEFLNLGHNRLESIPDAIQSLKSLRALEIDRNPIPRHHRPRIEQLIPHVKIEW